MFSLNSSHGSRKSARFDRNTVRHRSHFESEDREGKMSSRPYEVVLPVNVIETFERALSTYLENLGFERLSTGSKLGSRSSYEFDRNDATITLTETTERQGYIRVVVSSEAVEVEGFVLDAMTNGMADLLQILQGNVSKSSEKVLTCLIDELRASFAEVQENAD